MKCLKSLFIIVLKRLQLFCFNYPSVIAMAMGPKWKQIQYLSRTMKIEKIETQNNLYHTERADYFPEMKTFLERLVPTLRPTIALNLKKWTVRQKNKIMFGFKSLVVKVSTVLVMSILSSIGNEWHSIRPAKVIISNKYLNSKQHSSSTQYRQHKIWISKS